MPGRCRFLKAEYLQLRATAILLSDLFALDLNHQIAVIISWVRQEHQASYETRSYLAKEQGQCRLRLDEMRSNAIKTPGK